MQRHWVLGIAGLLAVAVAVPATAGTGGKLLHALGIAKDAREIALEAQKSANQAQRRANKGVNLATRALGRVRGAKAAARSAQASADEAEAAAGALKAVSAKAPGSASTSSTTYEPLPGGPSVTATVPPSGLIEVTAQALIDSDAGTVSLYEDGSPVPGQARGDLCGDASGTGALFMADAASLGPVLAGTPAALDGLGVTCASLGAPGPVLFERPPGEHTYELRYAVCGCPGGTGTATFSDRLLVVRPVP